MMILKTTILMCCCFLVFGEWKSILPWQVKTTLLELSDQFDIQSIRGTPKPIYRHDLRDDYVAYWYIEINNDGYVILSSSPKTGDYKLVIQGSAPSMLDQVDKIALLKKSKCSKYYMMTPTPDIDIACYSDHDQMIFHKNSIYHTTDALSTFKKLWENQRYDVTREGIWENSILNKHQQASYYHVIGDSHKIVVGDNHQIGIKSMNDGEVTHEEVQTKLCNLLKICNPKDNTLVDSSKFGKTKYGQAFLEINVPEKVNNVHRFKISGYYLGQFYGRRFMIDAQKREKRQTTAWTEYSIDDEYLFPDYNQHGIDCKKGWFFNSNKVTCCSVGCGPVAWAMVLGYYDRRSHEKRVTYGTGSQSLYNCGVNATSGSPSCEAPSSTTSAVKKLTEYLHYEMKTFCLSGQGATTQDNMKIFEKYFKSHQRSGNASVTIHTEGISSFVGAYNDDIRDSAFSYLRSKWPVVVGIRVNGIFSQHYPVATKYRIRQKQECSTNCTTSTETDMYLHMGWGGSSNGWRPAKMFFAGVARY
ncbi:hypothetical protein LOTGIDRAFT_239082 [Lottia gigantea]|uniref:Peptidase C1A papain C-terminal domain-containing protein n=1 Tax=Lottia gigantea TaxID=225164 RepID=V4A2Q1_LOTGI|nr:hypothetical protein LOTGIDRAFT_239082 [Lottia gigantea]ESO98143.1 hypothetical protein LOTGIDRAFT_239082 [Lottia gigantea]